VVPYCSSASAITSACSAYVSIRQHTSAYVSIRQHTAVIWHACSMLVRSGFSKSMAERRACIRQHTSAYRQHTVSILSAHREHTVSVRQHT
jgi:hypothetical protein